MKSTCTILLLLLYFGCNSSEKTIKSAQKAVKPILQTDQVAPLTDEEEDIIEITVIKHVQLYSETCKKKGKKETNVEELIFCKDTR